MKVLILAGGMGTRLSELTELIPKPMVMVGERPLIWHIMKRFSLYGFNDFVIALGYKGSVIKEYFLDYHDKQSNMAIDLRTGSVKRDSTVAEPWRVELIETGHSTLTAGRLLRCLPYLGSRFFVTYGDGLADIDIDLLVRHHCASNRVLTISAVHPPARFGELELDEGSNVVAFNEKPQLSQGWINGGFWLVDKQFSLFLNSNDEMLERGPVNMAILSGQIGAYKHEGYWQCVDTLRDLNSLRRQYEEDPLWLKKQL